MKANQIDRVEQSPSNEAVTTTEMAQQDLLSSSASLGEGLVSDRVFQHFKNSQKETSTAMEDFLLESAVEVEPTTPAALEKQTASWNTSIDYEGLKTITPEEQLLASRVSKAMVKSSYDGLIKEIGIDRTTPVVLPEGVYRRPESLYMVSQYGNPVVSPVAGTIVDAGWKQGRGDQVTIQDAEGTLWKVSQVGPLSRSMIGRTVFAGEELGSVTGIGSFGPGVRLEIEGEEPSSVLLDRFTANTENEVLQNLEAIEAAQQPGRSRDFLPGRSVGEYILPDVSYGTVFSVNEGTEIKVSADHQGVVFIALEEGNFLAVSPASKERDGFRFKGGGGEMIIRVTDKDGETVEGIAPEKMLQELKR